MDPPTVRRISECFVRPEVRGAQGSEKKDPIFLSQFDLAMLSVNYIQKGLLFKKPKEQQEAPIPVLLASLKDSLALTLTHFYPLAGRLSTVIDKGEHSSLIFIDPDKGPGAGFIHATLDMTVQDLLSPPDVPAVVQSFFDHDRAVNHDGHTRPLLSVQVTELIDGIFIGCSMNHAVGDGTSFWHIFNAWSEIHRAKGEDKDISVISRPPIRIRWFLDGTGPALKLPFVHPDEFVCRYEAPKLRERIFHFSSESLAAMKQKANSECGVGDISTFQALSALIWRCITRARRQPHDVETRCILATNNRTRLEPPLSDDYFGNMIQTVRGVTTVGELLEHGLGWASMLLHKAVVGHNAEVVYETCKAWLRSPFVYQLGSFCDYRSVMMGSSPRFNMYGNELVGAGRAVAVLSGYGNKFDGKVTSYPGYEGGGNIDLEICLSPAWMRSLESDDEFMANVYPYTPS